MTKSLRYLFSGLLVLTLVTAVIAAQTPSPGKRPAKNPPQYPDIIDLESTAPAPVAPEPGKLRDQEQMETLIRAVGLLTGEMRSLVHEIRVMNIRQQAQLDLARLSGITARVDGLGEDLRRLRERFGSLSGDEQNLLQMMTRESLLAQSANIGSLDREKTMEQIRAMHEAKLRYVQAEKERLLGIEGELSGRLQYHLAQQQEAEKRIEVSEDLIRRLDAAREPAGQETKTPEAKPRP